MSTEASPVETYYVTCSRGLYGQDRCEVCGQRPATTRVRWWDQPPGGLAPVLRIESHYFCARHQREAEAMQHRLRLGGPLW